MRSSDSIGAPGHRQAGRGPTHLPRVRFDDLRAQRYLAVANDELQARTWATAVRGRERRARGRGRGRERGEERRADGSNRR
eukprot:scaffold204894_cov31-Tisochrysis_lutea.AAC.2